MGEFCISLGPEAISLFLSWASKKTQVRGYQVAVCSLIWPAFSVFGFCLQSDLKLGHFTQKSEFLASLRHLGVLAKQAHY